MQRLLIIAFLLTFQFSNAQDLINAIKDNKIDLAKKLIKKGESVNQTDTNGATALMWAALKTDLKFCKYLVKKGADPKLKGVIYLDSTKNQYYGNLLGICVMNDKYDILEWLVKQEKIDINDREFNLEDGNESGWIPLQFAVYKGNETGIDLLIKLGANSGYISLNDSSNMLLDAINYGNTALAKKILNMEGVNFFQKNTKGFNALHYATYLNNTEILELLIKKGFDINVQNDSFLTPLHFSISPYFPHITKILIENNADTSLENKWGETPGFLARYYGYKGVQNILKRNYISLAYPPYDTIYEYYAKAYNSGNSDSTFKYSAMLYRQAGLEFYENTGKYGQSLNSAGIGFYKAKKYAEAVRLFKLSLEHAKIYRQADTADRIQYLENIINTYGATNSAYDSMKIYFDEFVPLIKQFQGDTSSGFFEAWRLKLFYLSRTGNPELIINEYKKLIRYSDSVGRNNTPAYFNTLNSVVVLYANDGRTEEASIIFDRILNAWKKGQLPTGFDFTHSLKNICIILSSIDDTVRIRPYLGILKTIIFSQKSPDFKDIYTYNFIKGAYYQDVQKFDSAFRCFNNCIVIGRNYTSVPENDMANFYLKAASSLISLNMLEEADLYLDTTINRFNIIKDLDPNYFDELNAIQITYYNFLEYKTVLKINPILLRMAEIKGDTALILNSKKTKFYSFFKDGQLENAQKSLAEILELENRIHKNSPQLKVPFFNEAGYFYSLNNDTTNAIKYYRQAIFLSTGLPNKDSVQLSFNYKIALLRLENGNAIPALKWFENTVSFIEIKGTYNAIEKEILDKNISLLINANDTGKAAKHCRVWLNIYKDKSFEKTNDWTIKLGDVFNKSKDFKQADIYYRSVEKALLKKYDQNSRELILIHAKLGVNFFQDNKYDLAIPYFKKVIEVEEKSSGSKSDLKSYYSSLMKMYFSMNDMTMSEIYSDKLLSINSNDIKSDFKNYLKSRTDHIFIKQQVGKYDEAEETANNLIVKMYRYKQFKTEDRINVFMQVGAFYSEIGNKEKALSCIDSSYAITQKYYNNDIKKMADAGIRKSLVYISNGKSSEGLSILQQQYIMLKNKVSDTSEILNETLNYLGLAYMYRKELGNAISVLKMVHHNYLSKNVTNDLLITSLNYSSAIYGIKKNHDSAQFLTRLAKNIAFKKNGKLEKYWSLSLEMARNYSDLKLYDSANMVFEEILSNQNSIGVSKEIFYSTLLLKAYVMADLGKYDESLSLLSNYMGNNKDRILDKILFLSASERENFISSKSTSIRTINRQLIKYLDKAPQFGSVILDNEIFIKGLALETNTKILQMASSSADPELVKLLDQIKTSKGKLDILYTQRSNTNETIELENKITTLEKALNKKLGSSFKEDYKKSYTSEIKNKLGPDEILVDFFSREAASDADLDTIQYYAILLAKDFKYPKIINVTNNKALANLFSNTSNLNSAAQLALIYDTRGSRLANNKQLDSRNCYDLIWHKIDSMVAGRKDVFITPSGYLNKIAFAAIKDNKQVYISDKYNIHVLSSSRQVLNAENTKVPKKKIGLVLGGIDYDNDSIQTTGNVKLATRSYTFDNDSTRTGFSYLPGTYTETQKIVSYLSGRKYSITYLAGRQASEEQFKQMQSSSPYFIHLATHGFYLEETNKTGSTIPGTVSRSGNPLLRSGLILAGGNKAWLGKPIANGVEDGILNSFEISNLDLRQTKFVVLSACETGLGDIKGSEGVFGLQRAFKLAGVEYIINSLWQVPDEQTSELMQTLYFHWSKGVPFEEAFFKAQKTLKAKYPPYYWAAFQLVK